MSVTSHQQIQILHVDDEPDFADLTGTFLEREDDRFTVETATSADDGLENITDRPPDCVISDYNMPGMDGIEFLEVVREEYPDLPFILFTGKGSEAVASKAIAANATDYLQKGPGSEKYELLANRIRNAVQARREAQQAERQEQLMRLAEFTGDSGGFELDTKSNTILLTAGTRRIIGRHDQHEMPLEEALKLFHPDDREDIQHTLDKVFETCEELHDTWRLQPGDGKERILDMTITPVVENGGKVTKLRGAVHDITEREENKRIARQRQKQLSLFFEESPLGAVQWDHEFQFERMNGRAEEILGYSEAELRGESWERIVAGDHRGQVGDAVEKLRNADGGINVINGNLRKDGEVTTCEWHNRAVTDANGNVQTIFSKFQDVTDRERRKTELQEYETIIEALSDAVYVLDEDGQFTYVNDEFVELVGYDRETILGNTPSLIKDEEAVQRAEQELGRLLSSDGPEAVTFEVTIHPRECDPVVCEDHMGVLPYGGEEFNGSVGTLRDVTEQKEREARLRETTKQVQGVIDTVESAMWIRNTDHEYVYMNQHHRDLFDIADDTDIAGKRTVNLHSAEVAEQFQHNDQRVYETREQVEVEEVVETDDGRRDFLTRIVPLFDNGSIYATCGIATDITEQKSREQKHERRYEAIFNQTYQFTGLMEPDGTLIEANEPALEFGGLDHEDVIGEPFWKANWFQVDDETQREVHEAVERAADGEFVRYDVEVKGQDENITIDFSIRPVTDEHGEVTHLVPEGRNITELKTLQDQKQELERQNDLFAKSQDIADVGAWEHDPQEQETYFTDMVYEIYGVESDYDAAPEKDIQKFYHPNDRDTVRTAIEEAVQSGKEYDIEVRITAADGTDKWIRTRGTPHVEDGTVQRVRGTIQDITERKEREQELQDLKSQYETLAENFPDGAVFLIDTDLTYVRVGGKELSNVGLSPDDIVGMKPHALFPEEIADELCRYYEEALDGNTNTFEQVYGGERYRIQTVPIRSGGEKIDNVIAVSQNITERAENRRELERQNKRLEEFANIVSHDLRNPLRVADGRLELVRDECESEHIDGVAQALDRMETIIEDVLTLARDSKQVDETERVGLANVAENSWQTVNTEQAALETNTSRAVRADQSRLRQLLENLYRNAVEHGRDGVTVSVGSMDGGFYVADTGPGIPESEREEVFEAGYSTNEDGTGFGLRIVEQIADAHGWEITVTESEEGGTRFEITGVRKAE